MKPFSLRFEMNGSTAKYEFIGYFDEAARLPFPDARAQKFEIDLAQIEGLSSYGVRSWCQWIKQIDPFTKIVLENCPTIFVKSFNSVEGFFTRNMVVRSFYVPYYSPVDDSRADVLYKAEENFNASGITKHPKVFNDARVELELDTLPNYFNFLDKK